MDPERWLAEAIKGDVSAFNRLVDYHQSMAYHIAYHHVGNADDAMDVCQEAMLSAWRAVPRFRGDLSGFRGWLARIVVNASRDRLRYEGRRPRVPLEADSDDGDRYSIPLPDTGESPEERAERSDQRRILESALGELTPEHREVVLLDHSGFSYAEMAEILEVEVGTVKSRLSRARVHLRDILTDAMSTRPVRQSGTTADAVEPPMPLERSTDARSISGERTIGETVDGTVSARDSANEESGTGSEAGGGLHPD